MTPEGLRTLERVHALTAWAATAALALAAWLFLRSSSLRRVAGVAAAVLAVVTAGLGLWLHDPYRSRLRQRLFLDAPSLGWLFERKQNLAFAAVLLAASALASQALLARDPGRPGARDLRRAAALGWVASAVAALVASVISAVVARRAHF